MKISFSVEGEFITNLARDWFYNHKVPYKKVKELLLSCMAGTDIPKSTVTQTRSAKNDFILFVIFIFCSSF